MSVAFISRQCLFTTAEGMNEESTNQWQIEDSAFHPSIGIKNTSYSLIVS
jgi:hypothetical protein